VDAIAIGFRLNMKRYERYKKDTGFSFVSGAVYLLLCCLASVSLVLYGIHILHSMVGCKAKQSEQAREAERQSFGVFFLTDT